MECRSFRNQVVSYQVASCSVAVTVNQDDFPPFRAGLHRLVDSDVLITYTGDDVR